MYVLRTRGPMEWQLYTPPGTTGLAERLIPESKKRGLGGVMNGSVHFWNGINFSNNYRKAHRFRSRESAEKKAFYITTVLMPSLIGELEVDELLGHKVQKTPGATIRFQDAPELPVHLRRNQPGNQRRHRKYRRGRRWSRHRESSSGATGSARKKA